MREDLIELHLGKKFGFEFNQSPGGRGVQFDLPSTVTKAVYERDDLEHCKHIAQPRIRLWSQCRANVRLGGTEVGLGIPGAGTWG